MSVSFPFEELAPVLDTIFSREVLFRPTHGSNEQDSPRYPVMSAADWVGRIGGTLWAPECAYSLRTPLGQVSTIWATSEDQRGLHDLVGALSELSLEFGYACLPEERIHRNRIVQKMSYGSHEAWVGRDVSRYLPGVYWLTVVPGSLLETLRIPIASLQKVASDVSFRGNRNWLIRLYNAPSDWKKEAVRVDGWCESSPGVFSKRRALQALANASSFPEAAELLRAWE